MSQTLPPGGTTRPADLPPTPDLPGTPGPDRPRRPVWLIVALVAAMALVAALVAVLVWPDDGEDAVTEPVTTETTEAPGTTGSDTTAPTTESPTTAVPTPVDASTAVFPYATADVRFDDPVTAARGFAVDFVGFTDPVVGEFMQGDARSGEVEVRPAADGPVTTVFVRQLGDDGTWWVLGSATGNISVDSPTAGEAITSPVTLTGSARAFEGTVNVEVRQDGARSPIGTGYVTGGGDVMRPFSGEVAFSAPSAGRGALVFMTLSAENGQVWEAATLRVAFG